MARYQVILSYDGTHFSGSQRQANDRTVQGDLEEALHRLGWDQPTIYLAGRTDTGTHAVGQVAAFDLVWTHGIDHLHKALNAYLPVDIAVQSIKLARADFRPRNDAVSRSYRYRLFCAGVRDPLRQNYAWRVWPKVIDLKPLAAIWIGTHDFASFGTASHANGSTIRTVFDAEWLDDGDEWTFTIRANAFLYRMVRRLVFVQVAAGQGKVSPEVLVRALDCNSGSLQKSLDGEKLQIPAGLAPACGLTLIEVSYNEPV
jgi:tRNA pseudouridine38-40 synthase